MEQPMQTPSPSASLGPTLIALPMCTISFPCSAETSVAWRHGEAKSNPQRTSNMPKVFMADSRPKEPADHSVSAGHHSRVLLPCQSSDALRLFLRSKLPPRL